MRRAVRRAGVLAAAASLFLLVLGSGVTAQETPEATEVDPLGAEVYSTVCAACHQTDGRGLAGAFPPLVDNPNVADAAYLEDVILNGREGEIVVGGETYNGVMPAFSTLSSEEVAAVVGYVQNELGQPGEVAAPTAAVGPVAGTELPSGASIVWRIGIWIGILAVLAVAVPTVLARRESAAITWTSAWLKAAVIVVFFAGATMWLPSAIIETGPVSTAPRIVQDLLASGIWFGALAVGLYGLWWAQRDGRI